MTATDIHSRIDRLTADTDMPREDKVAGLVQIYLDALALQRAANEGGMSADSPGDADTADGIGHAEEALRHLGVDPLEIENRGAATL